MAVMKIDNNNRLIPEAVPAPLVVLEEVLGEVGL